MRKWIHALTLTLALSAAFPTAASTISIAGANDLFAPPAVVAPLAGVDGPLAPTTDFTLPYRADGIFSFSSIDLGAGITLRFDPQTQNARLLSLGDILVAGMIDASGINLALETPGRIVVAGSISAGSISLANAASLSDRPLRIGSGGRISLSSRSGDGFPLIGPAGDVTLSWVGGGLSPIGSGGRISLSSRSGDGFPLIGPAGDVTLSWVEGGLSPTRFSVPEPATPWLIVTLLPLLMLFGRRHTSHGH